MNSIDRAFNRSPVPLAGPNLNLQSGKDVFDRSCVEITSLRTVSLTVQRGKKADHLVFVVENYRSRIAGSCKTRNDFAFVKLSYAISFYIETFRPRSGGLK